MIVSDLIKELKKLPQDREVYAFDEDSVPYSVESVENDVWNYCFYILNIKQIEE